MSVWTVERVAALAPDAGSASAGQALASLKKWAEVASGGREGGGPLWGLCQGSGKDPYQTRIDLSEPAFKCSCPSRKFPCKHALGLMLLYAKEPGAFKTKAEPGWVSEWIEGRKEKAEKKAEKAAAPPKPVDEAAQAKRAAKRDDRVREGVASCSTWLEDLARRGLAAAKGDASSAWERMAARMVDAQAPGLAGFVRRTAEAAASGDGWEVRTLDVMGRLHLLLKAAEKLDQLPADLAGDVRAALGFSQSKDEVLAGAGVADRWAVVGQAFEEDERLMVRRSWLVGVKTGTPAMVLDFTVIGAPGQVMDPSLVAGFEFDGELAFYPSRAPLRAMVKSRGASGPMTAWARPETAGAGLLGYAKALAGNPWLARWPMVLTGAALVRRGESWEAVDADGRGVPLKPAFVTGGGGMGLWRLLSATGGRAATVFGEWDGEFLTPLAAVVGGVYLGLTARWAA